MKERINKISGKTTLIISIIILCVAVIPIISIGQYAVPSGDDFSFSSETYHALINGNSVISAAAIKTAEVYYSWQGSFFAVFLMTLQPGIFGYQHYGITTVIMLAALIAGTVLLCVSLFGKILKADRPSTIAVGCIIAFMSTQYLPLPYQSFFWYNGSVYYTFIYGIMLVDISLIIRYLTDGGKAKFVLICMLSFLIGAGNYITALLLAIILSLISAFLFLIRNPKYKTIAIPLFLTVTALIISAAAPGNGVRQAENPNHPSAVSAVILSLECAAEYIVKWSDWTYAAFILVLIVVTWNMVDISENRYRLPFLVTVFSYLIFSAMFCPHIFAMGSPGPGRILNVYYFAFLMLTAINVVWWIGHLRTKVLCNSKDFGIAAQILLVVFAAVLMLVSVMTGRSATSAVAISELRSGAAKGYYEENVSRFNILMNPEVENAELKPLINKPTLLFSEDMKDDPDNYMNRDAATYFGKKSIIVK